MDESEKLRHYLVDKLEQIRKKVKIARRKRNVYQCLSAILIIGVIVGAVTIPAAGLSASIITVALIVSMIAGEISARFKFDKKKHVLKEMIKKLNLLEEKLEYVIQLNSNLTSSEYHDIIKQFTSGNA